MRVLYKILNENKKVIGATVRLDNGNIKDFTVKELYDLSKQFVLENAIIDINGVLKSKPNQDIKIRYYNSRPTMPVQQDISKANKLLNTEPFILYHGSKNKNLVPVYGFCSTANDYGRGFYTTPDKELGKEWSCAPYDDFVEDNKSYVYTFTLEHKNLNVLDLTHYDSMCWLAELLTYRKLNLNMDDDLIRDRIKKLKKKYKINTDNSDVIIGYRADDKYFKYAYDFVSGRIYRETLEKAMRNGTLGLQIFIKSQKAFSLLKKCACEEVDVKKYTRLYNNRNTNALKQYEQDLRENRTRRNKETIDTVLF